jgi:gluconokinase
MPASMLASQLAALEPPAPDEDAVEVGIDATPAEIADRALSALGLD